MKRALSLFFMLALFLFISCQPEEKKEAAYETQTKEAAGYSYEYVTNDAMNTRVYTLDNGLKVYLSAYTDAPRIQVYMPVKAGGKNDPASNTGLAHYLEHMMFKGNDKFGSLDYEKEKVLLDSIENMFNHYASLTDEQERKEYYKLIDQVSNEAAKLAIPNEYDKLIAGIGGKGLNAYTTEDRTVYTVDIPSNELEKFLEIESARFTKIVNRLFHTELEAVYEEKNRSLDNDGWKAYEKLYNLTFEKHPYGTQTVIGTIDHLKNPSITEIVNYFNTYYKPNNVAICMSGDLDYDATIQMIDQYFGDWKPNDALPQLTKIEEAPITAPREAQVFGPDAENISMGFRFDGTSSDEVRMVSLIDMLLSNSEAGLIDINLLQDQKVLEAGSYVDKMNDYSIHQMYGSPKDGQTLEEVRDLLVGQIEKIKKGEFEDWLIKAVITDLKQNDMKSLESNRSRANKMVMAFTNDMSWADYISNLDKMEKITKEEIVKFANDHYNTNYAIVYKRNGEDPNKQKVEKPQITKVPLNRDQKSDFHQAILAKESPKLTPKYLDYDKDVIKGTAKNGIEVLMTKNKENELFNLIYLLDIGSNNDPQMKIAVEYLEFLGTDQLSAEDFKKELYKLGCSFNVSATAERTYVSLNGLDENMEAAMVLFEDLLKNPKTDQEALDKLTDRILKSREDAKKNKGNILFRGLMSYGQYGAKNSFTNVVSNKELKELDPAALVEKIKGITDMQHRVLYYGPRDLAGITEAINSNHIVPETLQATPAPVEFASLSTDDPKVYWTNYDMVQTEFLMMHQGPKYDKNIGPEAALFNEYFGGGMNSIVFQEIREAQGLAYSVFSSYSKASDANKNDLLFAYVGTQADKQSEAMKAMRNLLNDLPESESAFGISKQAILSKIESERITKANILWNYESAKKLNIDYDLRQDVYNKVKTMTFEDLKAFHAKYVKDKQYNTVLIGNKEKINFQDLEQYGDIQELSLEEIFGYDKVERINVEQQ